MSEERSYYRGQRVESLAPLSSRAEAKLFASYQGNPTPKKREAIVVQFLPLALRWARLSMGPRSWSQRRRPGHSEDDAISAANFGLMKAVDRYDPTRGFRFSTYATYWIMKYLSLLKYEGHTVSIPFELRDRFNKAMKAIVRTGKSEADLAEALGETVSNLRRILDLPAGFCVPFPEDPDGGDSLTVLEPLSDEGSESERLALGDDAQVAVDKLEELPERCRLAVRLVHFRGRSPKQAAHLMRITEPDLTKLLHEAYDYIRPALSSSP